MTVQPRVIAQVKVVYMWPQCQVKTNALHMKYSGDFVFLLAILSNQILIHGHIYQDVMIMV